MGSRDPDTRDFEILKGHTRKYGIGRSEKSRPQPLLFIQIGRFTFIFCQNWANERPQNWVLGTRKMIAQIEVIRGNRSTLGLQLYPIDPEIKIVYGFHKSRLVQPGLTEIARKHLRTRFCSSMAGKTEIRLRLWMIA